MAYTALTAGQRDRAALLYQQWLGTHSEERDALLGLAYIAQRAGHDDEALAYYRRVLRQDPEHAQAHANVLTLNSKIDPNQAAISARDRVEQNPGSDATLAALGAILVKQGRLAEAALAFTHAQALAPGNATYAYNLAVARDRLHQYRLARGAYERAIALSSTAADTGELGFSRDAVQQRLQQLPASADYPSRALTELAER
jgi:tetratricopeptide (TPR) repeat protein